MIKVTRLDNSDVFLNPELIESVESTPDTMITLQNGKKIMVKESLEEMIERFLGYQKIIHGPVSERVKKENGDSGI